MKLRLPRRKLKPERYQQKWKELQAFCKDKATWPDAVIAADNLLDEVLKKRRMKGRTMGERLVKAQREFSDNDGVWSAHKLRNRLESEPDTQLKEEEVKTALLNFRQALKDLGALKQ